MQLWAWLGENSGAVSAVASCLTLIVWLGYFQLLYLGFSRAQRASILISVAGGPRLDAECILANMSLQPIYIEAVTISMPGERGDTVHLLSDLRIDANRSDLRSSALQGSLSSGEMISLGPFRSLLERAGRPAPEGEARFSLMAVGVYAGADRLIAAERFFIQRGEELHARSVGSCQLRSWRDRRRLRRLRRDSLVMTGDAAPR